MALLKCVECQSFVSDKAQACPKCGCPVTESVAEHKREKRRILYVFLGISLLVLIAVWIVGKTLFASSPDKTGYYNNISWGTSSAGVLEVLPNSVSLNKFGTSITVDENDFLGLTGVDALVMYIFRDDSLVGVSIYLKNQPSSSYTNDRVIELIAQKYDEQYGPHIVEEASAMTWKTRYSNIDLLPISRGSMVINFSDINLLKNAAESTI